MPTINISFDTDEQATTIDCSVSGPETASLTEADFSETQNGDGTYTYDGSTTVSADGQYTVDLTTVADSDGNDGVGTLSETVTVAAATTIDNFEDQDLSEYSGNTGSWQFSTSALEGSYSLEAASGASTGDTIISQSGLNAYPSRGDEIFFNAESPNSGRIQLLFLVNDADNHYLASHDIGNTLKLFKKEAGVNSGNYEVIDDSGGSSSTSINSSTGTNYRHRIYPKSGGDIVFEVIDPSDGSVLASRTVTESTFSSGGIGIRSDGTTGVIHDYLRYK